MGPQLRDPSTAMVVSGALVWCRRDGQLLPLRLDSIRLSGAITEAHWNAVTHFLDLVASQRLVIQDEGLSFQSTPEAHLCDGTSKYSDRFASLIQEQTYGKKYCLADCDGNRSDGLRRLSEDQECSAHGAIPCSEKPPKTHVQSEKKDVRRRNLTEDVDVMSAESLKNVVGETHSIFGPDFNVKQGVVPKFGIFDHDDGWELETCEETHQVTTVSKSDQSQRRIKVGRVSETLNLHYVLQGLKHVKRTEEVVAVLNCQECEQAQHVFSKKGGDPSKVLNVQCKQVPTGAVSDTNCLQFETQKGELKSQVQEVNDSCGVESVVGGTGFQNQQNRLHTTVNHASSSKPFCDNVLSCQTELQMSLPQWQMLKTEPIEYVTESTYCRSFTCQFSGKSCVDRFEEGALLGRIGGDSESAGNDCSSVSLSTSDVGNLSSVEQSAGNPNPTNRQLKAFAICEQCKFEMSRAVAQIRDGDGHIKHAFCQHQSYSRNTLSVRCCDVDQEAVKLGHQMYVQSTKEVTNVCQKCHSHCNLADVDVYKHDACHRRNNFGSHVRALDGNCSGQQSYRQIGFPHVNHHAAEQQQLIQDGVLDERILRPSVPASNRITSECQTKRAVCHQFVLEKRISRSGIPMNGPLQSKRELSVSVCHQCGLGKRISQLDTPERNAMRAESHEVILNCRECEMEDGRTLSERSQGTDLQQCEMKNKFQTATPEKDRVQVKCHTDTFGCQEYMLEKQTNTPEICVGTICHKCGFGKRMFQSGIPGRQKVCCMCQENALCCQECALGKQIMAPEMDGLKDGQQWRLDPSVENRTRLQWGREMRAKDTIPQCNQEKKISYEESHHQYSDDGVHHKKKRAVALWQRLLRKHVSVSGRRKWISVAIVRPTSSASGP